MRNVHWRSPQVAIWLAIGIAGVVALAVLYPLIFPLRPQNWTISRSEAVDIALERFYDLGEPVDDPYIVTRLEKAVEFEWYALTTASDEQVRSWRDGQAAQEVTRWAVYVYAQEARSREWVYRAEISLDGRVLELMHQPGDDFEGESTDVDLASARRLADDFLVRQGFDLSRLSEPEERLQSVDDRLERRLRYRSLEAIAPGDAPFGVEVSLAGDRLLGVSTWFDNPSNQEYADRVEPVGLLGYVKFLFTLPLLILLAPIFVRRYHHGELGVGGGLRIMGFVMIVALVFVLMVARGTSEGFDFGIFSRQRTSLIVGVQHLFLFYLPIALAAFLSWSVGESICRERWGHKLAAFDSIIKGRWFNGTVARSVFRGTMAGLGLLGLELVGYRLVQALGGEAPFGFLIGPYYEDSPMPGLGLVMLVVMLGLQMELYARLFAVSFLRRYTGKVVAAVIAAAFAALFFFSSGTAAVPALPSVVLAILLQLVVVCLFLRFDLMTTLMAVLVSQLVMQGYPWATGQDPWVQLQGVIPLLFAFAPMLVTLRYLRSDREFEYRYDDIPIHVRRIADRERQRVELETARNIQSSILPELPPRLNGIDLAHAYQPATEVGGDFYDVLALEDGRLALAVGDVAGHGVSSGLVMSMAKSALAVQVTFDPQVRSVFGTLNRMVYQSARKRMLTTLVYAVVDPQSRTAEYASAGHLFPYRVKANGGVVALESVAYPLGVRPSLDVTVRSERLDPGDTLFLFSDGVVEARAEDSDTMFGFDRLEQSLRRHAGGGVSALRDGVLADLNEFTSRASQEDDVTIVVARVG